MLHFPSERCIASFWEARGFWEARDRAEPITLRELRAVGMLLQRHFAEYISREETRNILLNEDNQAKLYILNAMVSSSSRIMQKIRRLQAMLHSLKVGIESRWLLSAVNHYADALRGLWLSTPIGYCNEALIRIQRLLESMGR
jgi:hypothetical protein